MACLQIAAVAGLQVTCNAQACELPGWFGRALCGQQDSSAVGLQLPGGHCRQTKLGLDHLPLHIPTCCSLPIHSLVEYVSLPRLSSPKSWITAFVISPSPAPAWLHCCLLLGACCGCDAHNSMQLSTVICFCIMTATQCLKLPAL